MRVLYLLALLAGSVAQAGYVQIYNTVSDVVTLRLGYDSSLILGTSYTLVGVGQRTDSYVGLYINTDVNGEVIVRFNRNGIDGQGSGTRILHEGECYSFIKKADTSIGLVEAECYWPVDSK